MHDRGMGGKRSNGYERAYAPQIVKLFGAQKDGALCNNPVIYSCGPLLLKSRSWAGPGRHFGDRLPRGAVEFRRWPSWGSIILFLDFLLQAEDAIFLEQKLYIDKGLC